MTKVLIDVDDEALTRAAELYGTKTKKDTVNTALRDAVKRLDRSAALSEMRELVAEGGVDLEVLADKRNYRR
ncbi:type II toxin-antitoxin system VapB family antitoxin [Nocardiopsis alborubida]|uniref:Type II toxin-antitoxin system VapB family antitoxin n=1 Tax=Nocardiopsis alborubida TaxID=146802 RepID=A0A7X6MAZ2_9ACTN|nr:type II toxin-antitoxin system VapB family antitoxin [Nocardiopsis alborubida]NKY97580.1 type II toxin-antitoxin system VapB family antitoxin [Nocardiopsis alborubida]